MKKQTCLMLFLTISFVGLFDYGVYAERPVTNLGPSGLAEKLASPEGLGGGPASPLLKSLELKKEYNDKLRQHNREMQKIEYQHQLEMERMRLQNELRSETQSVKAIGVQKVIGLKIFKDTDTAIKMRKEYMMGNIEFVPTDLIYLSIIKDPLIRPSLEVLSVGQYSDVFIDDDDGLIYVFKRLK